MSAGKGFSQPHIECQCGRVVTDDGSALILCKCGRTLIYREPIEEPCPDCGGKYTCHCVPDEN